MAEEIERKFRVVSNAWKSKSTRGEAITQAYLLVEQHRSVRVRLFEERAFLTLKFGRSNLLREEFEYPLPIVDAQAMLEFHLGHLIEKTRYRLEHEGRLWEVDVFHGELDGLVLAEIELTSELESFALPQWIGDEVTDDERYYNVALALNGLPGD